VLSTCTDKLGRSYIGPTVPGPTGNCTTGPTGLQPHIVEGPLLSE